MRRLIVNADDFGLCPEVTEGIVQSHLRGIVTATTCLVSLSGFSDAVRRARDCPSLDVGIHLNLTWGAKSSEEVLPRLAPGGRFRRKFSLARALFFGRIPRAELRAELNSQVKRFTDAFQRTPSHADVHQHVHVMSAVWEALEEVARDHRIPFVRYPAEMRPGKFMAGWVGRTFHRRPRPSAPLRTTDHFRGLGRVGRLDEESLLEILRGLPKGLTELMVHPGGKGSVPGIRDRLVATRPSELEAVTSPRVIEALVREGIQLTTFRAEM